MGIAARMLKLGTETAFEVLAKARDLEAQGRDVMHLEIGEPDFATPAHVVEAGVEALRDGYTHYAPLRGCPSSGRLSPGMWRRPGGRRGSRTSGGNAGGQAHHVLHNHRPGPAGG